MPLPQQQPKDSPAYQMWYRMLREGQKDAAPHVFAPRECEPCRKQYTPTRWSQKRCAACIAADPWHSTRRAGSRRRSA